MALQDVETGMDTWTNTDNDDTTLLLLSRTTASCMFVTVELDIWTKTNNIIPYRGLRSGLMDLGNLGFQPGNVDIENRNRVDGTAR